LGFHCALQGGQGVDAPAAARQALPTPTLVDGAPSMGFLGEKEREAPWCAKSSRYAGATRAISSVISKDNAGGSLFDSLWRQPRFERRHEYSPTLYLRPASMIDGGFAGISGRHAFKPAFQSYQGAANSKTSFAVVVAEPPTRAKVGCPRPPHLPLSRKAGHGAFLRKPPRWGPPRHVDRAPGHPTVVCLFASPHRPANLTTRRWG